MDTNNSPDRIAGAMTPVPQAVQQRRPACSAHDARSTSAGPVYGAGTGRRLGIDTPPAAAA